MIFKKQGKTLPNSKSWRIFPNFLPEILEVLAPTFRSMIQFELILGGWVWYEVKVYIHLYVWADIELSQDHLLKRLFFLYWIAFVSLSKIKWQKCKCFWTLNSVFCLFLYEYPSCLYYCSSYKFKSSHFVLLKNYFATWDPVHFHLQHIMWSAYQFLPKKKKKSAAGIGTTLYL